MDSLRLGGFRNLFWPQKEGSMLNIVLLEPEIPANTGNIGRTCAATGSSLHLIKPLGFDISEKAVRRAGMDYWFSLDLHVYENYADFREKNPGAQVYMATTKAQKVYTEVAYEPGAFLMFGKESAGIPEEILMENRDTCVRDRGDALAQPEQLGCGSGVRGAAAAGLRGYEACGTAAPA